MKPTLATLILCAVLSLTQRSESCDCAAPPPPKKSLELASAVFSGKCVDVVVKDHTLICTFEVDRVWKGEVGKKMVITTSKSGASCGYGFTTKGDATYLIYAGGKKGELETNICTRTAALKDAKEDLKELGDGAKPKEEKKPE